MSAAQGLLNSVFSCSSPASKVMTKRRLRQTRSLDPAIIRHCDSETEGVSGASLSGAAAADAGASPERLAVKPALRTRIPTLKEPITPSLSSPSIPLDVSPSSNFHFDFDTVKRAKRNTAGDLPYLVRGPGAAPSGSTGTLFSPRRWLQRKVQPSSSHAYVVWKSEGDFTWSGLSGRSVRLTPVAIQSLSELERARLQEVAYTRLHQDYDLGCQITMPKDGQKRKKSLRRKLDSLAKEKSKDKECIPQAFQYTLSRSIANDRSTGTPSGRYRQTPQREEPQRTFLATSSRPILQFATKRPSNKELSSSNSSLSSTSETANESTSPNTPEAAPRARRRGGMSVDSITDLDDNQSRLLEALQLSLPAETPSKKEKHRDKRLSLNPIYRQVPRVVDSCCQHIEKYGLQTVGIFRVGSSKKRVRQLREEFDRGVDVQLDEEHSIHDVAALLKEFLRDMPDPLLTKELYTAFINTTLLDTDEQHNVTQLLVYLLPACNSDTLHRLLEFLSTVTDHAHDRHDKDGQEITGNKMTSLNLATIFGPNLLHKQKSSDKEFSVQSSARAEESTAVIAVLQRMIASYQTLFMVPPDLQNEVLMSLLETDPDVVDYLLRRKASQSPDLLQTEEPFTLSERRSSSDSNKASSGEVSPYDNNSPVLSERRGEPGSPGSERLCRVPEQYTLVGQVAGWSREPGSDTWGTKDTISEEHANIWGTWHTTLKPALKDQPYTGSHGNMSEGSSRSSQEGLDGLHGDGKQPATLQRTLTAPGITECRPHPPVTRVCTSPHVEARRPRLQLSINPSVTSHLNSTQGLHRGSGHGPSPTSRPQGGANTIDPAMLNDGHCPPPYNAHHRLASSQSSPQLATGQRPPLQHGRLSAAQSNSASTTEGQMVPQSPEWQDWQRDRWQIWQLLSSDNADALPETLV
ncbi:LOW QUALITY PROTEIN: rho GTPase-activating protein 6-like [Morone saxatilis]|uniref:LOW QUALITY PROTEIN: rho GTPase-activating protein 6-like n=1 Tax=Morone saxatilis TaxID=34816 RepID=UPI0015E1BEE8|nr:LOW QUALITY PROTEIN: rho GTPase-activating protein 6-like [Morone saxatilis]